MSSRTLAIVAHTQPTVSLTLTVNIHADKTLLFLAGLVWMAFIGLGRLYELGRAVIVVAWRRIRRAWRRLENRIEWTFSGLVFGPCLGMG